MLIAIATVNVAIAILCLMLTWRILRFRRQVTQLNRDLNRWTVLLEETLTQQTLALTEKRTDLRQWQLIHLKWQLQQRRIIQIAKLLRLISLFSRRRLL
ncbi:hypothetical protein [Leptothoe spongobia]|uniref:Uncharacterized protein n=1 Tax=Leptothoe spongobia TAU-MAC 1115 TaxID=1967444 RepID=A0A947DH43_9CYAN|nr:hypothetical protein [Leptothoe spongobia]MBT9316503.1 hypothetical protein [Leptothoe spongobia TAU-MAC 1115]